VSDINLIFYILLLLVVVLQTIAGVGVLVLGTPLLLILEYSIVEAISILLPISILTSLINLIYFKFSINKKNILTIDKDTKKSFFKLCMPAIFFGILFLKIFHDLLNFKIIVSLTILTTVAIKTYYGTSIINFSKNKKKIILFFIGIVHGVTNSGGALLSIFILNLNNNLKNQTRYVLTFFYFFLALVQYLIFIMVFQNALAPTMIFYSILIVLFGIFLGNFLTKFIDEKYFKFLVQLLAIISALFLIML